MAEADTILARLAEQQTRMFEAVESALADLADPERLKGIEQLLSAQESAMADLIGALEAGNAAPAMERLAEAVRGLKLEHTINVSPTPVEVAAPAVTVNVEPTPITVEAVMPQPAVHNHITLPEQARPRKWRVQLEDAYGGPGRAMTIEEVE